MAGLFDPIDIKGLRLKNRIVMAPMATSMATPEGAVTDRHLKHYGARAEGGAGLVIIEHTYVMKNGQLSPSQLALYSDGLVPGLRRLVQAIHDGGARVCIQLTHAGGKSAGAVIGEQPVGPSSVIPPGARNPHGN